MPEWGRITVGCKIEGDFAVGYVTDTGVGISKEHRDKIFEPFYTSKEVGQGTGLGLYMCHTILANHDGQINVESEEGRGTTFTIKLPLSHAVDLPKDHGVASTL